MTGDIVPPGRHVIRMRGWLRMRRFYIDAPRHPGSSVSLSGTEARHAVKVLRLAAGDGILLFDRLGGSYTGTIAGITAKEVTVRIDEKAEYAQRHIENETIIYQAVLKSDNMDFVVQKCTELGVDRIQPFFSARCIPRWDDQKCAAKARRWKSIAVSAVKQSGVGKVPEIPRPADFMELVSSREQCPEKLIFWERERTNGLGKILSAIDTGRILFAVGPEGGFTDEEIQHACAAGFKRAGLGTGILRAETAPIAVLSILQYVRGGLG